MTTHFTDCKFPAEITGIMRLLRSCHDVQELSRRRHLAFRLPDGSLVFCPQTPSDWRGGRNLRALLRRRQHCLKCKT